MPFDASVVRVGFSDFISDTKTIPPSRSTQPHIYLMNQKSYDPEFFI